MDSGTLADARIVKLAPSFVCVRVDSDEREDLLARYVVRDLPCLLFLPPEGVGSLGRLENNYDNGADRIVDTMNAAVKKLAGFRAKRDAAAKLLAEDAVSASAQRQMGDAYAALADWERALPHYEKAIELAPAADANHEYELEFLIFGALELRRNAESAAAADRFLAAYPQSKRLPQILYWRGVSAQRLADPDTARRMWERVVAEFPNGPWGNLARAALAALSK